MTITSHQFALPPATLLMEYRVNGLLGAGAFGITYLARDTHLDKDVAIKEYLPSAFAARAANGSVVPITQHQEQNYRWGLSTSARRPAHWLDSPIPTSYALAATSKRTAPATW